MAKKAAVAETAEPTEEVEPVAEPVESEPDPYVTLYRKYRPHKFAELMGQDEVRDGIRNAIRQKRVPHAMLLSGERGCGKTTTARIIAAALNCPFVEDGEPCGECDICVSIFEGNYSGVVNELNATDNRGIDDMRNLLSTVDLASMGNYKVYIIDEVHGLTKEAASLLLKTLEEPPNSRVIFLLATTDPHKVLDTIRSRTTQFKFRLLGPDILTDLVHKVVAAEGIEVTEDQVRNAVAAGRGSARDTLSMLERVVMGIGGEEFGIFYDIVDALLERNIGKVLVAIAQAEQSGTLDPRNIAEEILEFWRNSLVYQQNPDLVTVTDDYIPFLKLSSQISQAKIVSNMEVMAHTLSTMRASRSDRIALEGGLSRTLIPMANSETLQGITDTLAALTQEVKRLSGVIQSADLNLVTLQSESSAQSWPDLDQMPTKQDQPRDTSRPRRRRGAVQEAEPEETEAPVQNHEVEPEAEQEEAPRPSRSAKSEKHSDGKSDPRWESALEEIRGRSRILLDAATVTVDAETDEFTITTERRLTERVQARIAEYLKATFITTEEG